MVCDENLSKFLANKNLNTLYMDFLGQKILILNSYSSKTKKANFSVFGFEDDTIFKLENAQFKPFSLNDFLSTIRAILEDCKNENAYFERILERKENILLKGNLIKNFFKKSFILKQKINKNLKNLSLLDEALNLLAGTSPHKKALKPIIFAVGVTLKNNKEIITRLNELHLLMSAIKNEKMNQSLYFLSILSAIFLPLNLIVGFFGMNTNDLFLSNVKTCNLVCFCSYMFYFIKWLNRLSQKKKERIRI